MTSDLDLLGQFARGESQDAFTALVNRHLNLVYTAALRQVRFRDPDMAGGRHDLDLVAGALGFADEHDAGVHLAAGDVGELLADFVDHPEAGDAQAGVNT